MENNNLEKNILVDDELLNNEEFKLARKLAVNKVLLASTIYFVVLYGLGAVFGRFILPNIKISQGFVMIILTLISIIPIILFIGEDKFPLLMKNGKYKFTFTDFIFFMGLMYIFSLAFGYFTKLMMEVFKITSVDVTAQLQSSRSPILMFYAVIVGPFLEELQYRGFYLSHVKKYGLYQGIILSGIIFSLAHMNFIQGVGTMGIGLILGYVAYYYSFKAALILHISNNFMAMIIGFLSGGAPMQTEPPSLGLALFSWVLLGLIVFTAITLFSKHRKNRIKENLKFTKFEIEGLKALFTNVFFIIYVVIFIALAIVLGAA